MGLLPARLMGPTPAPLPLDRGLPAGLVEGELNSVALPQASIGVEDGGIRARNVNRKKTYDHPHRREPTRGIQNQVRQRAKALDIQGHSLA